MSDKWGSPLWLVALLAKLWGAFDLDAASERWSAVAPRYITERQDIFSRRRRARRVYLNPPYSKGNLLRFVGFARDQVLLGVWGTCTLLVPHYTAERWWARYVARPEGKPLSAEWDYGALPRPLQSWLRLHSEHLTTDIILPEGRLVHRTPPDWDGAAEESARYSSAVVRFSRPGSNV